MPTLLLVSSVRQRKENLGIQKVIAQLPIKAADKFGPSTGDPDEDHWNPFL